MDSATGTGVLPIPPAVPGMGVRGSISPLSPCIDLTVHSPGLVNPPILGVPFLEYGEKYSTHDLETGGDSRFLLFS